MNRSCRRLESVQRGLYGGRRRAAHREPAAAESMADPAMDSRPAKLLSDRDVLVALKLGTPAVFQPIELAPRYAP